MFSGEIICYLYSEKSNVTRAADCSRLSVDNYYGFSDLNLFIHPFLNSYAGIVMNVDIWRAIPVVCKLQLKILHWEKLCCMLEVRTLYFFYLKYKNHRVVSWDEFIFSLSDFHFVYF